MRNLATRTTRRSRALNTFLAAGAALALGAAPALATPEGETVVYGDVTFVRNGDHWTIYVGDLAIIQWASFDIDPHEIVQFIQPGADSRVLNRILSGSPTTIDGQLLGNGQIYLVNPSGVIFGKDSVVNVGAIYAAAGNISNHNFLEGRNQFVTSGGSVQNFGTIEGDLVSLVGSTVANHGTIRAREGTVIMAAGEKVVIGERFGSLYVKVTGPSGEIVTDPSTGPSLAAGDVYALAAWNTGTIEARETHIESTGTTLVSGTIDASGREGGTVKILGEAVELHGATIDATGTHGGGTVLVGGGERGKGHDRTAQITVVDADTTIAADATRNGDGGSIVVWSEQQTTMDGALSARGGERKGDGGFIETSSKGLLSISRAVDAGADNGDAGLWLIDPTNIIIVNGNTPPDMTLDTSFLGVDLINTALSMGTGVFIDTNSFAGGQGNIIQVAGAPIIKSGGGLATLTMRATGDISLFGGVFDTSGNGLNLNLLAGTLPAVGPTVPGRIAIYSSLDLGQGAFRAEAGKVQIYDTDAALAPITVDASWVDLVARNGGSIEVGGDITTTGAIGGTDFGVRMNGGFIGVSGDITTHGGAGAQFTNSSVLTLAPSAVLDLDGRFVQDGAGPVLLGADITTTLDDVLFAGDVTLLDDVLISTFDGVNAATPTISFAGSIDSLPGGFLGSPFSLGLDAGNGTVFVGGNIGANTVLDSLSFRGRTVTVQDVHTAYSQTYIADTAVFQGTILESTEAAKPTGFESAQIQVLGDGLGVLGFAGNTRLENNLTVRTAGAATNLVGQGDDVMFTGSVVSDAGQNHTLTIDAGDAEVIFGDTVGDAAGSALRLGFLEVLDGVETRLFGDVYTSGGMNFWTPVEVNGFDTTIHTGEGVAFFGDSVYAGYGYYDDGKGRGDRREVHITFAYDGGAWIDLGSGRAPFKFRGNIGTDSALSAGREFTTIQFGSDLGTVPASASFLFGDGVLPGTALTPLAGSDLNSTYHIWATDSIVFGQGEKVTSFGSLEMIADNGFGNTLIQFGDVNVLGDFLARAVGGEVRLRLRDAFGVEFAGSEDDRFNGAPISLLADVGAEIIATGSITLDGANITMDSSGTSSSSFLFANDAGAGVVNGQGVLAYLGGVDSDDFLSMVLAGGMLYPYDLTFTQPPAIDSNLGLALRDRDDFEARYQGRYLPDEEVLAELNLQPREIPADVIRASLGSGVTYQINDYSDYGAVPAGDAGTATAGLTIDRVSRPAIARLTDAYVALLGERVGEGSTERVRSAAVKQTLADAWGDYGGADPDAFRVWAATNDADAAMVLGQFDEVFAAFERLELPAHEKAIARDRLVDVLVPGQMPRDAFEALFAGNGAERVATR
ncbi:MAG: hypothetical protein DHS20C14_12150 [Phycisphaeraceae bacterium]|nr:MAG: hypothetical protein DHS20C14_12150 [Phycisphaeraceae bacterium]